MDRTLSWLAAAYDEDSVERALSEADAAIALVVRGVARSVRLSNLPGAEAVAFDAAARAQAAGVAFSVLRDHEGWTTLIIGPRLGPVAAE